MSRTQRRVSRGLIALLIMIGAIGGVFYLTSTSHRAINQAKADDAIANRAAMATNTPLSTPTTKPLINIGPANSGPATQPIVDANHPANVPSTQSSEAQSVHLTAAEASTALAAGLSKKDAGDLLGARLLLNNAIQSSALADADLAKARAAMTDISNTLIFSPKHFADDEYGGTYTVQSGDVLKKIAESHDVTWELLCRTNGLSDPKKLRAGATLKVIKGPFHAVVIKHAFTMDLYVGAAPGEAGSMYVMSYPVGLGRDDSTPTGVWQVEIHRKIKNPTYYSPRGEGIIDAGDPKNPIGDRWIGLTGIDGHAVGKLSYGIHGTIEPDSIGKQSSMGCIRMHNEDVEKVFDLLVEGKSLVIVKD